jgi:hypothetical protein
MQARYHYEPFARSSTRSVQGGRELNGAEHRGVMDDRRTGGKLSHVPDVASRRECPMTNMPPVPPANRSPKGTGSDPVQDKGKPISETQARDRNLAEQGRQGNIKQNTTNQGHQQDR